MTDATPATDPQQPTSPPGGGSWRWDTRAQAWAPNLPEPAPTPPAPPTAPSNPSE
jgi:hypothetical protein